MKLFIQASREVERTSSPSLVSSKWRALTSLIIKELKQQRFWATDINRMWSFFHFWTVVLPKFFGQIVSMIVKTLRNTNLVASRWFKRENTSLPGWRVSLKKAFAQDPYQSKVKKFKWGPGPRTPQTSSYGPHGLYLTGNFWSHAKESRYKWLSCIDVIAVPFISWDRPWSLKIFHESLMSILRFWFYANYCKRRKCLISLWKDVIFSVQLSNHSSMKEQPPNNRTMKLLWCK